MNFWQKIKVLIPLKHILFLFALFAVTIAIFQLDSAEDIKVTFGEESVDIVAQRYMMNIPYDMIDSVELTEMPRESTEVDGRDNMVTRIGLWTNDAWGEHYMCADMDCTNCIKVLLNDGRIFVFSRKNNQTTEEVYNKLLSYLN